jgi:hypothetical protein
LKLSSHQVNFRKVSVGQTAQRTLVIRNAGKGELSGTVANLAPPYAVLSGAGAFALAQGQALHVTITFGPSQALAASGSLLITSDDPKHPSANVTLHGAGK